MLVPSYRCGASGTTLARVLQRVLGGNVFRSRRALMVAPVVLTGLFLAGCTSSDSDLASEEAAAIPSGCRELTASLGALSTAQDELMSALSDETASVQPARDAFEGFKTRASDLDHTDIGNQVTSLSDGLDHILDLLEAARSGGGEGPQPTAEVQVNQSDLASAEDQVSSAAAQIASTCSPVKGN